MATEHRRSERVAEAIREEIATFLGSEVKDPRVVGLVTVTGVDVTRASARIEVERRCVRPNVRSSMKSRDSVASACDAFAAMTSHRPYRTQMGEDQALAEMRRCAGSQFDPECVAALEDVLLGERSSSFNQAFVSA